MFKKNTLKIEAWIAFALFCFLLFGAIYYYRERMLFADAAHIAFSAINDKCLQIQQYRFGSFVTQIVPVIGAKMGLSVKAIMIAYSASFNIFYLFVAAMLLFVFRAYRLLILFAFYWALVTTHTFFWPNNEVHQGIAYMFLLFPVLNWAGERKFHFSIPVSIVFILGSTAVFCHPLVLPPLIFLWVYLIVEKKNWHYTPRQTIWLSACLLFVIVAKLYVSKVYAGYDRDMLVGVTGMSPASVFGAFSNALAKQIYAHVSTNYWLFPVIALLGIVTLLIQRKFMLAIWTLGCGLVYFVLICLTFPGYIEFNTESEIMPLIIILTAPFVFVTLASIRKEIAITLVALIFFSRYLQYDGSEWQFKQRVKELSIILAKMKDKGLTKMVLVKKESYSEWRWMVEWSFSAESMMLSASIWDKPVRQFVIMSPAEQEKRIPGNKTDVIDCFITRPIERLDMNYFRFDTTQPYTVLSYEEFIK